MQHHLLTASYHDLRSCGIECTYDCFRITEHARTERRSLPHADRLRLELICSLKQLGLNDGTAITRQYSKLRHYAEQIMARGYDSPTLSQVPLFVLKSVILDPADQPVLAQLELNSIARPFGVLPTADATAEASVATVPLYCIDSWLRANPPTVQVSVALTPRKPGTQNSAVPPLKLRQLRLSDSNPAPLTWPRHAKEHRIRPAGVHTAAQAHPTVIGVRVFVGGRGGPGLGRGSAHARAWGCVRCMRPNTEHDPCEPCSVDWVHPADAEAAENAARLSREAASAAAAAAEREAGQNEFRRMHTRLQAAAYARHLPIGMVLAAVHVCVVSSVRRSKVKGCATIG